MYTFLKVFAIILLLNLGLAALYGGWMLISDPSGQNFNWTLELLSGTPFKNFLLPGIILFVLNGVSPLIVILLILMKYKFFEFLIIIQGSVLIAWLTIEILLNSDLFVPFMHYPFYISGLLLVLIGVLLLTIYKNRNGTDK